MVCKGSVSRVALGVKERSAEVAGGARGGAFWGVGREKELCVKHERRRANLRGTNSGQEEGAEKKD